MKSLEDVLAHPTTYDVVIVGGGPSGSACAYWLASAGWSVCLIEKKHFPREKTCGDGLTPRSVHQLAEMGLEGSRRLRTDIATRVFAASALAPNST